MPAHTFLLALLAIALTTACSQQDPITAPDMWALGDEYTQRDADLPIDLTMLDDASVDSDDTDTPQNICVLDADTDFDGLADCEELALGTDPLETDTDGDTLTDYEEFLQGTNPLEADSDGDGLSDLDEIWLGLDPNDPHTERDDVLDGDLFFARACDTPHSRPTKAIDVTTTTWRLAMPTSAHVTQLTFMPPSQRVSVLYEDEGNLGHTAGFATRLEQALTSEQVFDEDALSPLAQITDSLYGAEFSTQEHDFATSWHVRLRTSSPRSALALRDDLLFALTSLEREHLASPLPAPSPSPTGQHFITHMTFIEREEATSPVLLLAVRLDQATSTLSDEGLLDDWTNTSHLSTTGQALETSCYIAPNVYDLAAVPPPSGPITVRVSPHVPVSSSLRVIQAPRHATDASQTIELSRHASSFGFAYISSSHRIVPSSTSYRPCSSHQECEGNMLCDSTSGVCVWQNPQALIMHHAYFVEPQSLDHAP